jgi:hypothetical protein
MSIEMGSLWVWEQRLADKHLNGFKNSQLLNPPARAYLGFFT